MDNEDYEAEWGDLGDWYYGCYFDDAHKHGHKQGGGVIHFCKWFADVPAALCKCHRVDCADFLGLKWKDFG